MCIARIQEYFLIIRKSRTSLMLSLIEEKNWENWVRLILENSMTSLKRNLVYVMNKSINLIHIQWIFIQLFWTFAIWSNSILHNSIRKRSFHLHTFDRQMDSKWRNSTRRLLWCRQYEERRKNIESENIYMYIRTFRTMRFENRRTSQFVVSSCRGKMCVWECINRIKCQRS